MWFFIFQFVRHYSWAVVEKWIVATVWSLVHRLFSAPGIRMVYVIIFLFFSQLASGCDTLLGRMPHITTFPAAVDHPPVLGGASVRQASAVADRDEKSDDDDDEEEEEDVDFADFADLGQQD
eukprot:TRINITY_DN22320_c0_g1_i1.p1 TRINITY_DN22320_c0_g1~~TRINITY_DN22320_c0_g1_i1.p1  ORF type:complete len:122 (-),score=19.13 TRINITY_DN22320_c0_g1_i1:103-468(-)